MKVSPEGVDLYGPAYGDVVLSALRGGGMSGVRRSSVHSILLQGNWYCPPPRSLRERMRPNLPGMGGGTRHARGGSSKRNLEFFSQVETVKRGSVRQNFASGTPTSTEPDCPSILDSGG